MLFNHIELIFWLLKKAWRLPIEACIKTLDQQRGVDLLSIDETTQILRIFELFGRFDLMLVVATISMQKINPETKMQLGREQLKNIEHLLQETTHLIHRCDFSAWPTIDKRHLNLEVMSPLFKNTLHQFSCNRLMQTFDINLQLNERIFAYIAQNNETCDSFFNQTKDDRFVDQLRYEDSMCHSARRALMQNPLYAPTQSVALKFMKRTAHYLRVAFEVNHDVAMDFYLNESVLSYASAYQKGWKPGRQLAYYLEYEPAKARKLIRELPAQVQADLIYFTFINYGIATNNLLGNLLQDQSILNLLSREQQKGIKHTQRFSSAQQSLGEMPPYVLGKILALADDKNAEYYFRGLHNANICRELERQAPTTKKVEFYLNRLVNTLDVEIESLLGAVRNPEWMRRVPSVKRGFRVATPAAAVSLGISAVALIIALTTPYYPDIELPHRAWPDPFYLQMVGVGFSVFLMLVAISCKLYSMMQRNNALSVINRDALTTQPVREQQIRLQETVQLISRLLRLFSSMDYYQYHFEIFAELNAQIEPIKMVCGLLRDFRVHQTTRQIEAWLEKKPFEYAQVSMLPKRMQRNQFAKLQGFFKELTPKTLRAVQDDADLMERLERHHHEHLVQSEIRAVHERARMYLVV